MKKALLINLLLIALLIGVILLVVRSVDGDEKQDDYYINPRAPWQNTAVEKELYMLYAQKEWQHTIEYDDFIWDSAYDNTDIEFNIVWNKLEYGCSKKCANDDYLEDCVGEVEYDNLTRKLYRLSNISDEYAIAIYYDSVSNPMQEIKSIVYKDDVREFVESNFLVEELQ